jgi:hypothetical protein
VKARTHYVFSAGVGIYLLSLSWNDSLELLALVLWLSFSVNFLIDALGHSRGRSGNPARTMISHSIFTAPVWGGLIGLASLGIASRIGGLPVTTSLLTLCIAGGALIAIGHLFLDSLTQAGVYYWKHRIALAHFAYDNTLLNAGFLALGLAFAGAALLH